MQQKLKKGLVIPITHQRLSDSFGRAQVTRSRLNSSTKIDRLLDRGEKISNIREHPPWLTVSFHASSRLPKQLGLLRARERLNTFSYQFYGRLAAEVIKAADPRVKIYHYRAGFGGESVAAAKHLGMITLWDHSIVHPSVLSYLVNNGGKMPAKGKVGTIDHFWSYVLAEINQADAVLVNSDFVKRSFLKERWESARVHTIY